VLTDDVSEVTGTFTPTQHGVSYLGDTIVFLRYVEMGGELRKVIGVLKKRAGGFERSLREFEITGEGLVVGDPLDGLRGVLRGIPEPDR
jgi:circadian clock protein KaiC